MKPSAPFCYGLIVRVLPRILQYVSEGVINLNNFAGNSTRAYNKHNASQIFVVFEIMNQATGI